MPQKKLVASLYMNEEAFDQRQWLAMIPIISVRGP